MEVRYSEAQILGALRDVWADMFASEAPFDADTRLDVYMKADLSWDELDFADLFWRLEKSFGFKCPLSEWQRFPGADMTARSAAEWERLVAPQFTFGALARFIAKRAPFISFAPAQILGRECPPAGAFMGIQRVARDISPNLHIGPSTEIFDVLRGSELDRFWSRLRWLTEHRIPELPVNWLAAPAICLWIGCLGSLGAAIALAMTHSTLAVAILMLTVSGFLGLSYWHEPPNPLPEDLQTFRQLAVRIAEQSGN